MCIVCQYICVHVLQCVNSSMFQSVCLHGSTYMCVSVCTCVMHICVCVHVSVSIWASVTLCPAHPDVHQEPLSVRLAMSPHRWPTWGSSLRKWGLFSSQAALSPWLWLHAAAGPHRPPSSTQPPLPWAWVPPGTVRGRRAHLPGTWVLGKGWQMAAWGLCVAMSLAAQRGAQASLRCLSKQRRVQSKRRDVQRTDGNGGPKSLPGTKGDPGIHP